MPTTCAEYGAVFDEVDTCQSIFDSLLVLEFTDPGYGEVHFLTVACFMIQHGRYSDEALVWIQKILRAYLDGGLTTEQLRRQAGLDASNRTRACKVMHLADAPPPKTAWSITIVDVAAGYQDAQSYCALVKEWARKTLEEMGG